MEACIESRKRLRNESNDSPFNFIGSKVLRLDSDEHIGIKHADDSVQEDLLKNLDDADASSIDRESPIPDLESVIRSFEEEIHVPVLPNVLPELGYLLEASDDELGLPPVGQRGEIEIADEVLDYCWLDNLSSDNETNQGEEVVAAALGGLFDDTAELPPYRLETLSCL